MICFSWEIVSIHFMRSQGSKLYSLAYLFIILLHYIEYIIHYLLLTNRIRLTVSLQLLFLTAVLLYSYEDCFKIAPRMEEGR